MNVTKKTKFTAMSLMILCWGLVLSLAVAASADAPNLVSIASSVESSESTIQDLKIEYTCLRIPYGSKGRDLTRAEKAKMDKYPGWYKQETGVWIQKGDKIKLERNYYFSASETDEITKTMCYDGLVTKAREHSETRPDLGVISKGRSHSFRRWFNPLLTFSATGDKNLSQELGDIDTELVSGSHEVKGKSCQLVKVYKNKTPTSCLRSYKVYLDPKSNYAPVKIEKYWNNFRCLEQTVEVTELTKVGNIYLATKALYVNYNKPSRSDKSYPVSEQELTVTNIELNEGVADSEFELTFYPGTRVWNDIVAVGYKIPQEIPKP